VIQRRPIAFRAVNRRDQADYDPALQRHHLLPRQALSLRCFARLFAAVGRHRAGFDDFRRNGLLLPARAEAVRRLALPLHRGPHRLYNAMVLERLGQIEAGWSAMRGREPDSAGEQALFRLSLLQRALRRRLLDPPGRRMVLNTRDPLGSGFDFAELDAMAEQLWGASQAILADSSSRAT
jgi:hypothetical protein